MSKCLAIRVHDLHTSWSKHHELQLTTHTGLLSYRLCYGALTKIIVQMAQFMWRRQPEHIGDNNVAIWIQQWLIYWSKVYDKCRLSIPNFVTHQTTCIWRHSPRSFCIFTESLLVSTEWVMCMGIRIRTNSDTYQDLVTRHIKCRVFILPIANV